MAFLLLKAQFYSDFKIQRLAFTKISDKTNHMSKFNVRLIGTAQWSLENEEFYFGQISG